MNTEEEPESRQELLSIVERRRQISAAIPAALDAMEEGMGALRTVFSLIADQSIISNGRLRRATLATFERAERYLESHHRFKTDMQAAQKTLIG